MRKAVCFAAAILAASGYAVNVQIGFSSYNHELAMMISRGTCASHSSPWQSVTVTISGVGGGSHFDEYNSSRGVFLAERYEMSNGGSGPTGVAAHWEDPNNPMRIRLTQGGIESGAYYTDITIAETVKCPTFGWVYAPYIDYRLEYGVFTMRGNPFSIVMNDTSEDRVVNGVEIKAGESARLPFPFWLKMGEVENIRFFDLTTGEEFFGQSFPNMGYYNGSAYAPMWTGDFRFTDGTTKEKDVPIEPLVFGDMSTGAENKLLYADNGFPIYANGKVVATNIYLMTEWEFDHGVWGSVPMAYINDTCVCSGHSTTHIIDYTVSTDGVVFYGNGKGYVDFTMWQTPQSDYSGGSCVMRCWDKNYSSYANAPAEHRAEISAGLGVARFRVTINVNTGEWKVEPN